MNRAYKTCIFFLIFPFILHSQHHDIKFEHISTEQGLSSPYVKCILQDNLGFMWFGTAEGLNKYDGYNFTVYRNDPEDVFSLSNNEIRAIYQDSSGLIWVGTSGGGLNCFDPETGHFTVYQYIKDTLNTNILTLKNVQQVNGSQYGEQYIIWIGSQQGLYKFNTVTHKFTCYSPTDQRRPNIFIRAMIVNRSGNVWIGTSTSGLYYFDAKTEQYTQYQHDPANPNSLSDNFIWSLCEDRSGIIWIGTMEGLNRFDPVTREFTRYYHDPSNPNSLRDNSVISLYEDSQGLIWIGTSDGLHKFDKERGQFSRYYYAPRIPQSISDNWIWAIYEDRSGVIWIGTGVGLNKIVPQKAQFKHPWQDPTNPNSLYNKSVNSIYETSYGGKEFLWIGTEHNGIYRINRKTGDMVNYRHDPNNPSSLSHNMAEVEIKSRFNGKDELWIKSYHGLNKLDIETGQFTHFFYDPEDPNSINGNTIDDIFEDQAGVLWISTLDGGLQTLNRKTGQFTSVGPKSNISQIYEDKFGRFWIASGAGLIKLDRKAGQFTRFSSDENICLYESSYEGRDILWIGTDVGLDKFETESEIFTRYIAKDGLPSEIIYSILEDNNGNLWLSTDNGLSRFNPESETFRNYDVNDGLVSNQFSPLACYKSKDGELFFGSSRGFDAFYPDSLQDDRHIPPIVLTKIQLFNKPVKIRKRGMADSTNAYSLPKHISALEEIVLSYKENIFSFEFAALDYRSPQKNQYAYKMEGFEKDWNYTGANRRFASYTNLDPGEYVFKVKGSNNDGIWNEEGTSIKVIILPPWWKTNWAYSIYVLLILSMVYGIWRFQSNRLKVKQQMEMKDFEAEKLREVDQLKSRFFANISHEFRTPLTLIKGPVKQMLSGEFSGNMNKQFRMILRNSDRLLGLINQILDLSKLESGKMKLQVSRIDIAKYLNRLASSYASLAENKKVALKVNINHNSIIGYADTDKLEKIVTNLLSNALKFTPEGGNIEVALSLRGDLVTTRSTKQSGATFINEIAASPPASGTRNDNSQFPIPNSDFVEISVSNTGSGIPYHQLDKIFDRFYQVGNNYKDNIESTGIGLALTKELVEICHGEISVSSNPNKTTTFVVTLPLGKEYFKDDEILEEMQTGEVIPQTQEGVIPDISSEEYNGYLVNEPGDLSNSKNRFPLVLVVEDNPDLISYISSFLNKDYRIASAENGRTGLKITLDKYPDLVISDVMMSEMDGYKLCHKIKKDTRISHIPVILLTAKADIESKIEGLEFGADDYISKPFDSKELQVRVKNLIAQRRLLKQRFSTEIDLNASDAVPTLQDKKFTDQIMKIVYQHLSDSNFNVEKLAGEIGMSRATLHRKISGLFDQSPGHFVRTIRLKHGADLLKNRNGTISEIAYQVGFSNPANFSASFRRQFGISPSHYSKTTPRS